MWSSCGGKDVYDMRNSGSSMVGWADLCSRGRLIRGGQTILAVKISPQLSPE